jgi:hypothetical protein
LLWRGEMLRGWADDRSAAAAGQLSSGNGGMQVRFRIGKRGQGFLSQPFSTRVFISE